MPSPERCPADPEETAEAYLLGNMPADEASAFEKPLHHLPRMHSDPAKILVGSCSPWGDSPGQTERGRGWCLNRPSPHSTSDDLGLLAIARPTCSRPGSQCTPVHPSSISNRPKRLTRLPPSGLSLPDQRSMRADARLTTEARIPAGTANSDICRSRGEIWSGATTGSRDCRSPPPSRYRLRSRMPSGAASPDRIQMSSRGSPTGKAGVQLADGNCTPVCVNALACSRKPLLQGLCEQQMCQ
jgi:hypothetical protein